MAQCATECLLCTPPAYTPRRFTRIGIMPDKRAAVLGNPDRLAVLEWIGTKLAILIAQTSE